jgi:hypothetical protein
MCSIDWTALGAWVAAIAAIIYGYLTWKLFREQYRPVVIANFHVRNRRLILLLQNPGNRPAMHVTITFSPPLDEIAVEEDLNYGISFYKHLLRTDLLTPGERREGLIQHTPEIARRHPTGFEFSVYISYQDMDGRKFRSTYSLNTADLATGGSPANIDHQGQVYQKLDENFDKFLQAIETLKPD